MEAICFSEMLGSVRTKRRYNPEDSLIQAYYRENLEFAMFIIHTNPEYTRVYVLWAFQLKAKS
jgi:hypothetical protein